MKSYHFVTVNPSDYAIVFKNGNIVKEGRGFRFFCTPRIQYVVIPGNVKNITFVADQISKENQGVEVSGFAIWKVGEPKKIYQHFDFKENNDTLEQVSEFLKDVVESAIRHMVANMTIEEVLRKRGTIILQLKEELKYISEQWGIVVETIEIKNVRILSKTLFDNMQAQFRNAVRFEAETNSIETERQIEEQKIRVGDQTKIIRQKSELADRERKKMLQLQEINDKAEVEKHHREQEHARKKEEMALKRELVKEEEESKLEAETNSIETARLIEERKIRVGDQTKVVKLESEMADRERKKQLQLQDINDKAEIEKHQREQDYVRENEEMTRMRELMKEEEESKRLQMLEQSKTIAEEEKIQALKAELDKKKKQLEVELQKLSIAIERMKVETENMKKDHRIIMAENLPSMLQNLKIERLDLGGTTLDTLLENIKEVFDK